jgi:Fe-Mn family superoxide dismutase
MANYALPPLPYDYSALEPWIDEATMRLHHDKHHAAYVANLNKAIAGRADLEKLSVEDLVRRLDRIPSDIQTVVRNHGGGFANHSLFWEVMAPKAGGAPTGALGEAVTAAFGGFEQLKEKFSAAAMGQFGSGWAWLVVDAKRQLAVYNLPNQDSPFSKGDTPILALDVWEHAYYLKYQNRRAEYVQNFWNVINWAKVADLYQAMKR